MARIAGVNIPQNKLVKVGLTYIYGIGEKFWKKDQMMMLRLF